MRVSREVAAASKERIIREAARLMRENGIAATSVSDVMTAAGMTTGGFYKHFTSKDELIAAAVHEAFDSILESLKRSEDSKTHSSVREKYLKHYLSKAHVSTPGKGCPVAAMGAEAGRANELLGSEFSRGIELTLEALGEADRSRSSRADLIRQMSMLVGAVVLARAVGESDLRGEILTAVRNGLDT